MRLLLPILTALALLGCQTTPPDYGALTQRLDQGETVAPAELRRAFLEAPDLPERMERLSDLETQALALMEDEPLRLGSIGSAILDTYYGSLTGHHIMARFYEHVASPGAAAPHQDWVRRVTDSMEADGDGSRARPFPAVTSADARMYAISKGWTPVGSIYQSTDEVPFSLLLQARPESGPTKDLSFDLSGLFHSMRQDFMATDTTPDGAKAKAGEGAARRGPEEGAASDFTPFTLIGYLARQGDSAAQTAVGWFLASQKRLGDAADWLRAASRTGNMAANSLLARVYLEQALTATSESERAEALDQVMETHLHAIALGSADAMYALGVLYLNGHYGDENKVSGVPLLKQAADAGHSEATMFLGHLHYTGEVVPQNLETARDYYAEAAALGSAFARKSYARFLLDRDVNQPGDPRALEWLEELAQDGEAESMLLLGNLHARGVGTEASVRKAVSWFKQAVEAAPEDPNIVNEVAWTLAVSDQQDLRRARYARRIMDRLMEDSDEARGRPEYLDTWAATYAATGDFERAVTLQEQALDAAESGEYQEVLEILRQHLEAFRNRRTISETVP